MGTSHFTQIPALDYNTVESTYLQFLFLGSLLQRAELEKLEIL